MRRPCLVLSLLALGCGIFVLVIVSNAQEKPAPAQSESVSQAQAPAASVAETQVPSPAPAPAPAQAPVQAPASIETPVQVPAPPSIPTQIEVQTPVIVKAPAQAQGETPAPAQTQADKTKYKPVDKKEAVGLNAVLFIDDFNHLYTLNLMRGVTQGDEEEPGGLIPSFTPGGNMTMGRMGHSLKTDYDVSVPFSMAFYSTRMGPTDPASGPGAFFPANLEGFNYVSFWVKTIWDYPRFAVEMHEDGNNDHLFTLGKDPNSKIAVSSFMQTPTEDISGKTVEIIEEIPAKSAVGQSKAPDTFKPAAKEKQPQKEAVPRKSRRTQFFYYKKQAEEGAAEKAMIKPASAVPSKMEDKKTEPAPAAIGSITPGSVIEAPPIKIVKQGKARWRKVVVPLSRFPLITQWSQVLELVFLFDYRLGSEKGIIYIDDVVFGTNYMLEMPKEGLKTKLESMKIVPVKRGLSPAAIRAVEMRLRQEENLSVRHTDTPVPPAGLASERLLETKMKSRERLKCLFELKDAQEFKEGAIVPDIFLFLLKIAPVDPTLEFIHIEVSNDEGLTWNIASTLANHQADGEYALTWRLAGLAEKSLLKMRLVASDLWGRSTVIAGPMTFIQDVKREMQR